MSDLGLNSFYRNFFATFFRQIGVGILSIISVAIIARTYGPEGNGIFAIAILVPTMLGTLLNLGIAPANVYFLGSSQVSIRNAIKTSLRIFVWLSSIGLVIGVIVLKWKSEELFPGVNKNLLWLAIPLFPMMLLSAFILSVFHGLQEFKIYNRFLVVQPILFLGFLLLLNLIRSKSLELLVISQLVSNLISLLIMIVRVTRLYKSSIETNKSYDYTQRVMVYGWKSNLSNVLSFLNYKADIFLVNFFLNPISAGVYVIAVTLAEKLWLISSAVSTVLLPRLSQLSSDEEKRKVLTPLISRLVLTITFVGSIFLAILSNYFISLIFGEQYKDSLLPLLILLPGIVILGTARVWANDIAARGRPEINTYISLITLLSNIAGNIIFIPKYGLAGAALATSLAYLICSIITLMVYIRITHNKWFETLFLRSSDIKILLDLFKKRNIT